jgi:hypothetical protein
VVRFTARDIAGLVLTGDMYAAPYDLVAATLGVTLPARSPGTTSAPTTRQIPATPPRTPGTRPACWSAKINRATTRAVTALLASHDPAAATASAPLLHAYNHVVGP